MAGATVDNARNSLPPSNIRNALKSQESGVKAGAPAEEAPQTSAGPAVKVQLSEQGKKLAESPPAASNGKEPPPVGHDNKNSATSAKGSSSKAERSGKQEINDLVQFYAKKLTKAAREMAEKELQQEQTTQEAKQTENSPAPAKSGPSAPQQNETAPTA
jgi:hypothetical protein